MQISMFDGEKPYKINKPIRLIELFAGIGSQAKALRNLGANFEHYRLCEFDKYAVQSYNAVHGTNFKTSDITKIKAADLGITEIDKYEYIMTYSFPCQDLSIAGKQSGMAKGSGTRSGLLWEVERLLKECKELPQVLLMENVPQVLNCDFGGWLDFLDSLGYKNYYKILNAKNFGVPQNRKRCFMVSVLGNYYYDFPKETPLRLRLKDMLESKVDEKYYLRAEQLENIKLNKVNTDISKTVRASGHGSTERHSWDMVAKKCQVVGNLNIPGRMESACRVHGIDGIAPACNTCGGGGHETKIAEPTILQRPHGFNKGAELEHCPSITTSCWESNNLLKEPIIVDDIYNNREPREYGDTAPTLRSERQGLKVVEPIPNERFFRQAIETANKNECENGDTINAFNKTVDKTGISPTLDTRCDCLSIVIKDNNICNLFLTIFDLCGIIDNKEIKKYERSKNLLSILWETINKKEIWKEIRRFWSIQEKEILQSRMYEKSVFKNRGLQSKLSSGTSDCNKYNENIENRKKMFNMWENWKIRYTSHRWELSEQQFKQFNLFMSKLSYETTSSEEQMQDMWKTNESIRILRETLSKIQEIWRPTENKIQYRIRKLVPLETWRLMGFTDSDFDKAKASGVSNSQLYKQAGNSIVVKVLEAIFKQMTAKVEEEV